jgi:chorismate mutase
MNRESAMKALADCRERIDALDRRMLALLNERTRIVQQIGHIKEESGMPVYEPKREEQVLKNVEDHNSGPMDPEAVRRIFERIIDEMRALQHMQLKSRDGEDA